MPERSANVFYRQSNRPAAAVTLSFSLGILFSLVCNEYSFGGLVAANISLICASFLALRRNRLSLSLVLGLAAISMGGLLMALAHRDGFSNSDLRYLLSQRAFQLEEPVSFEGCVVKESELRGEESTATIELEAFLQHDHWIACKGKGILSISMPDPEQAPGKFFSLTRGDRVKGWATWQVPHNYENPGSLDRTALLSRRGIFLIGRAKSPRLLETIPGGCSDPWTKLATAAANRVRTSLEPLREKQRGQPAAILASLVIGDYSGIDNITRESFQNSGTFHVLVVSGLHVAWIAALLLQFFKLIRLPERIRYLLAALAILLYTCVVGFQASITRCLWMFLLYLAGRMIFRRADPINILLAAALILLVAQPDWLFEAGFQLSFLSVMAIAMTAAPAIHAYLRPVWEPLRHAGDSNRIFVQSDAWYRRGRSLRVRCEILIEEVADSLSPAIARMLLLICRSTATAGLAIGSMIVVSISIQIWLEPLLACHFNRISWIAPLANLVIVPFSSIVLASGIVGTLAADLHFCGPALIQLAGSLSSLLLFCATRIAMMTGAWQRCPTPGPVWILAGVSLLFIWGYFKLRRFWIPCTYIFILLACLSYGSVPVLGVFFKECRDAFHSEGKEIWRSSASILRFTFLDVGEGDSIVVCFPDKRLWLLDAGGLRLSPSQQDSVYAFDVGEAVVSRYLWHGWITRLDRLILSHTDLDHAGGAPAVIRNFSVAGLAYSPVGADDTILNGILGIARENNIVTHLLYAGMEEKAGPVTVRCLNPAAYSRLSSTNENSLVLQFSYKRFSALLTGDLEKSGESEVLSRPVNLSSHLLKVAHHASRSGTSNAFLDRAQPRWAVVSVGRNPFGHPSPEVIARLLHRRAQPILTRDEGAVTFETDGSRYLIKSHINGILEQGDL